MQDRSNYIRNNKNCLRCGTEFIPKGQCSKYCSTLCRNEYAKETGKAKEYRDRFNSKLGKAVGVGSGGLTKQGESNPSYTTGRNVFRRWAREYKETVGTCMRCGKDIKNVGRWEWCGHHKDHNPQNNVPDNLEVLCKRCHQMHHDAGWALRGKCRDYPERE